VQRLDHGVLTGKAEDGKDPRARGSIIRKIMKKKEIEKRNLETV